MGRFGPLIALALLAIPLSAIGGSAQEEAESDVDRYLRLAREASPVVRPQAARRLVGLGEEAAARVLELTGGEPRGYARLGRDVVEILGELPGAELRADLWESLDDRDFPWRPSVARTLGKTAGADEAEPFIACLADPLAAVRTAGIAALGVLDDMTRAEAVRPLLADPHDRVRREAAVLLDRWGDPRTLWHLVEDLKRTDRFLELDTGKLARFESIRLLSARFGERFGFAAEKAPTTPENATAIERFEERVRDATGGAAYELPEVAKAGSVSERAILGLEIRSCRRGEFFLRWTEEDVLLVGTGNPARIGLTPGVSAALASQVRESVESLGDEVFWGEPGCDSETFTIPEAGGMRVLRVSKGPWEVQGLRPTGLLLAAEAMLSTLAEESELEQGVRAALTAVGGPMLEWVPIEESSKEPTPKALLVFIDGFLPDAIAKTKTPTIDRLMRRAAWSLEARAESTTISGSGWSTFLNGVHWDKHNVPDNEFAAPRYADYPHVIARFQEARPAAKTASANCWEPIESGLVTPAQPDQVIYHDYYAYSDDYWDDASCDTKMAQDLAQHLRESDVDLAAIMFGELDGVGHSDDNSHYHADDALYQRMLSKIDGELGWLIDAIEARETYASEDWLIIVSADHGGSQGLGHGQNIPSHRRIPLIVSGKRVARGEVWPPPSPVDIATTALAHLKVSALESWELDGVVLGREKTARPLPKLGENLIFNGDAEYERGYAHYTDAPDASVPGWDDPSWMTTIVYGAGDGFPTPADILPEDHGRNFFSGGGTAEATWIEQSIPLAPLRTEIAGGIRYELSAWLGGHADQEDRSSFSATFYDATDEALETVMLGPVTVEDRQGTTAFRFVDAGGKVPVEAHRVVVRLQAEAETGTNDGYADNLSLILR